MASLQVLFKLPLLTVASKSFVIAFTPPNPPAKKKVRGNFFETYVHQIVAVMINIFWFIMALDALATVLASGILGPELTKTTTDAIGAHICPSTNSSTRGLAPSSFAPSSTFLFHTALLALSALGRLWCYRTLGKHFRYEVSIQEKHHLVTSGPYAFVRHPSYLALYGTYISSLGLLAAKGTWSRECILQVPFSDLLSVFGEGGVLDPLLRYPVVEYVSLSLMGIWFAALVCVERNLAARLLWEDGVLKNEFGKEWVEYARRVPWRIVPFVF